MVLLITQNAHVKILLKTKFFFFLSFMGLKALFYYTWKLQKLEIPLSNSSSFFDLRVNEVFLLLLILWKNKKIFDQ
jgi:hypothetical protein